MAATQSSPYRNDKSSHISTGLANPAVTAAIATTARPTGCRPSSVRTRTSGNLSTAAPVDFEDSQATPVIYVGMETEQVDNEFIPQVDSTIVPKIGLEFQSDEKAHIFYNTYAKDAGFSIKIRNDKRNKKDGTFVWRDFTCSKEGKTNEPYWKNKHGVAETSERRRGEIRCNCPARMSVRKNNEVWVVKDFEEKHNHPLATPKKTHLLRSHRVVSATNVRLFRNMMKQIYEHPNKLDYLKLLLVVLLRWDAWRRILGMKKRTRKAKLNGHDAVTLIHQFEMEKERNEIFFYVYETDDDGVFLRCFWSDSASKNSYALFGSAVVFDTTYNINKYGMVFAPFVGVNHHRQTTVFGCGLLSDEKTESFVWLFSKFLDAMINQPHPEVIITDQDAAISVAVAEVFPDTIHRYCIWHILNKFSEKLGLVLYNLHYRTLSGIIKDSETPNEYESRWNSLMSASQLSNNEWLSKMYDIRCRWVPAYMNGVFSAGMCSDTLIRNAH